MSQVSLILAFALFAVLAGGGYLFFKRRKRNRVIADVLSGENLIGRWSYHAAEWQQAVAEEFSWAKASDGGGEIFISPRTIYIKSASSDHLIELNGSKVVTHASYRGTEGAPLKIRVRWKVIESNADGVQQRTKYYKEDYRIPVPLRERAAAEKVVLWFSAHCEKNLDAYADVVGADEALSIFGDDSF
jgi:LPXTG-motif cell wall-anchored protein